MSIIEYKEISKKYHYTKDFDEIKWLNKLGKEGWVLICEPHTIVYGSGNRIIVGKFWRPK